MIHVSVIGVGYWGPNLIRNFVANDQTQINVASDLQEERLDKIRKTYPSLRTTRDHREIINDPNIDLVTICTPVSTHYEIARAALEAGKHVIITKPMTATSAESEELLNIAERKNLRIFVDHTFIYHGAVRKIKDLIQNRELGDLYYFDSVRINLGLFQHDVNVIWDLAPHDISIMHYLLGEYPEGIVATGADHWGSGLENVAYLTIYFKNNLIAHIHVNWLSPVKIRQTLIAGSKKMVAWDDTEPSEKVRVYDKGFEVKKTPDQVYDMLIQYRTGDMYCPQIDSTEALATEIAHYVDCLETGKKSHTDGETGLMCVKVLEAAQKSIKARGREITI